MGCEVWARLILLQDIIITGLCEDGGKPGVQSTHEIP
jgi:hypothetical protein